MRKSLAGSPSARATTGAARAMASTRRQSARIAPVCQRGRRRRLRGSAAAAEPAAAWSDRFLAENACSVEVVRHPLAQGLDRLVTKIEPLAVARERVGLVHEEHAVERLADDTLRLDRGQPHVLPHETGPVDLHEMAALQEPHRAVHLRQQTRNGRLARARVAEKDEVLRGRDLTEARLLPPRLNAQEGNECP